MNEIKIKIEEFLNNKENYINSDCEPHKLSTVSDISHLIKSPTLFMTITDETGEICYAQSKIDYPKWKSFKNDIFKNYGYKLFTLH